MQHQLYITWVAVLAALLGSSSPAWAQPSPGFGTPQQLTNQEVRLKFSAPTGQVWRVDVSTSLSTNPSSWRGFLTLVSSNLNEHLDSAAPFDSQRFYRARQLTNAGAVTGDHLTTTNGEVIIHPLSHASLLLRWNGKTVYVDPTNATTSAAQLPRADLILLTHDHPDHFSTAAIDLLRTNGTVILAPTATYNKLTAAQKALAGQMANGSTTNLLGLTVTAVPAYNLTSANHPKGTGNGYVLTLGGKRLHISGDTDDTPELRTLRNLDVQFLCMRPTYTMTMAQAAAVVRDILPRVVYPYHYYGNDVNVFKQLVGQDLGVEVRLRRWY